MDLQKNDNINQGSTPEVKAQQNLDLESIKASLKNELFQEFKKQQEQDAALARQQQEQQARETAKQRYSSLEEPLQRDIYGISRGYGSTKEDALLIVENIASKNGLNAKEVAATLMANVANPKFDPSGSLEQFEKNVVEAVNSQKSTQRTSFQAPVSSMYSDQLGATDPLTQRQEDIRQLTDKRLNAHINGFTGVSQGKNDAIAQNRIFLNKFSNGLI
jgi:alpha-galactosidase/6-phospho-beta-glucosidase family protein